MYETTTAVTTKVVAKSKNQQQQLAMTSKMHIHKFHVSLFSMQILLCIFCPIFSDSVLFL
jgi:hypothetical protein